MKKITKLDKKIIGLVSQDIPLVERPFEALAENLGIDESQLISTLKTYKKDGWMRKLALVSNHRKMGFKYNAMVVWNVPEEHAKKNGDKMASFQSVSHCYQRRRFPGWNHNLYTMIHGKTKKECLDTVKKISKKTGIEDYRMLFSSKEYKKIGVKYV